MMEAKVLGIVEDDSDAYCKYVQTEGLLQSPCGIMSSNLMPLSKAVVAADLQNEWTSLPLCGMPTAEMMCLSASQNCVSITGLCVKTV